MDFIDIVIQIRDFFTEGIYEFFYEVFREITAWYVIWVLKAKIAALSFAFDVASTIMTNLNLSQHLNSYYSMLDSRTLNYMAFFRLPDALNLLIQAYITRFTLSVIGW
jgi:hypothetical protein